MGWKFDARSSNLRGQIISEVAALDDWTSSGIAHYSEMESSETFHSLVVLRLTFEPVSKPHLGFCRSGVAEARRYERRRGFTSYDLTLTAESYPDDVTYSPATQPGAGSIANNDCCPIAPFSTLIISQALRWLFKLPTSRTESFSM